MRRDRKHNLISGQRQARKENLNLLSAMDIVALDIIGVLADYVWPITLFLIGLTLVVFVHEFGHFLAAKWAGVMVEKFAIGFGPKLIGRKWGETEYRINVIPLGGYVGMLGQDDTNPAATSDDARSWQKAEPGKKIVILAAGAFMNIICAGLAFVIIYMVGIRFVAPVVGAVDPDLPAAKVVIPARVAQAMGVEKAVGLKPGDRIRAINGKPVRRFRELNLASILSSADEVFELTVTRPLPSGEIDFKVKLAPEEVTDGQMAEKFGPHFVFGIDSVSDVLIFDPGKDGYADKERFKEGDRIVEISGLPVVNPWDYQPLLRSLAGKPVSYVVERDGERLPVPLAPLSVFDAWEEKPALVVLGMAPRVLVAREVGKRSPAGRAGIMKDDVIVSLAGHDAPSLAELKTICKQEADKEIPIRVLRAGKVLDLKVTPETEGDGAVIGIAYFPEQDTPHVAEVLPDTPAAKAGVPANSVITKVNDTPVATWAQVYAALRAAAGEDVSLTYRQGEEETTVKFGVLAAEDFNPDGYLLSTGAIAQFDFLMTDPIRCNPAQAIQWSVEDTVTWTFSVYKTLRSMITGRASHKALSGPVGIGVIAVRTARRGLVDMAYFMAMISALIAVFNILPLPVLDGGHIVFTIIEKVRGRPLPTRLLVWVQTTGFVMLIGLFVLITYQDILRWFF